MTPPAITGVGQISNVGPTVESSCAAQRAGISRVGAVEGVTCYDPVEMETPIIGAPIRGVVGFSHNARWISLATLALEDLARNAGVPVDDTRTWGDAALLWLLPVLDFNRFLVPEESVADFLDVCCANVFLPLSRIGIRRENVHFLTEGPVAAALACTQAQDLLNRNRARRVLILATDSWLDPLSLMHLNETRRLKTPDRPTGICPGEGAACVLLEPAQGADVSGFVLGAAAPESSLPPGTADAGAWRDENTAGIGSAIAEAVRQACQGSGTPMPFRGDVIVDLNGEHWRASAWGHAQPLLASVLDLSAINVICPAMSFGDVGATAPVAAMCIAVRSYARRYASASRTLIVSVSDLGRASAIVIGRGDRA